MKKITKYRLIIFIVCTIAIITAMFLIAEIKFYIDHGEFYYEKSLSNQNLNVENSKTSSGIRLEYENYRTNFTTKNKIRILTIGGSTTYCHTLIEECWPYILEDKLNTQYPDQYEVLNLGMLGYTTKEFVERLEPYLELQPDMIILAPIWNDIILGLFKSETITKLEDTHFISKTAIGHYVHMQLYTYYDSKMMKEFFENQELESLNEDIFNEDCVKKFEKNLDIIITKFQDNQIPILLLTMPAIGSENDPLSKQTIDRFPEEFPLSENQFKTLILTELTDQKIINQACEKNNIGFLDYTTEFNRKYTKTSDRLKFFGDESHFNNRGNTLVANYIFNSDEFQKWINS